jgi:hypothetical protein
VGGRGVRRVWGGDKGGPRAVVPLLSLALQWLRSPPSLGAGAAASARHMAPHARNGDDSGHLALGSRGAQSSGFPFFPISP